VKDRLLLDRIDRNRAHEPVREGAQLSAFYAASPAPTASALADETGVRAQVTTDTIAFGLTE